MYVGSKSPPITLIRLLPVLTVRQYKFKIVASGLVYFLIIGLLMVERRENCNFIESFHPNNLYFSSGRREDWS